jgi:putative tryptophan/tyrosine transport system substrate-binding protein
MRRRGFVAGVGASIAWPVVAAAQRPGRTYRIAMLASLSAEVWTFWDELKRNGFVTGQNLVVDRRGKPVPIARLDAAAAELVKAGPDAIVAWGPAAGHAAQSATKSVPIVVFTDDPVQSGLATSMAHPGGNTTGVGILAGQLDGKRLEILHELVPAARRIGLLVDPTQVGQAEVEAVGRNLDLELITREVRSADDIGQGIDALAARKAAAINVLASLLFYDSRALIIERTRALGLPTIYWWADLAREGGLISFGPNFEEASRLLARQVSRVLNGASPAKLPLIQPTRFELVINLKTARALGLTVPPSLLARADEVIE